MHRAHRFLAPPALLLALVASLVVVGAAAAPSHADTEWSVAPASADGPDERISLRHVIEPGASVADQVAVSNLGDADATFTVAAGDGVLGSDGAFDIAPGEPTGSGGWIAIGGLSPDGTLTVPAGQTAVLPVTITVPADATPGDAPAGIAVGLSSGDGGVTVTHRVGVRLHLQVAGEIEPALDVTVTGTDVSGSWVPFGRSTLRVEYEIENTGNARIGAGTRVEAGGVLGLGRAGTLVTTDEMLPGDTASGVAELEVWPTLLVSGSVEATGLVVGQDDIGSPGVASADFRAAAVPWTGLVVLVLVAGGVVAWRRRRPTPVVEVRSEASPDATSQA